MSELLGITGAIGSGKSTFATLLGQIVQNHAHYETGGPIIEIANRFNQLLEAELNFETADDNIELVNQALIWMPDVIAEHLHCNVTWAQLAIIKKDMRAHPELYEKLLAYLQWVRAQPTVLEKTITAQNKADYRDILQWFGGYFKAKIGPNVWCDEVFRRIELHESFRDLVLVSGVRFLSDALYVRERGGRIVQLRRADTSADSADVTEAEREQITPDITVINNGTLAQLQLLSETIWNDIAAGKVQKIYRAA